MTVYIRRYEYTVLTLLAKNFLSDVFASNNTSFISFLRFIYLNNSMLVKKTKNIDGMIVVSTKWVNNDNIRNSINLNKREEVTF